MPSPVYRAPATVEQAIALLAGDPGARPMSGGTDLIVQMRSGRVVPSSIVDLKRIERLHGIRRFEGGFAIGAATPCTALLRDAALAKAWPGVVEAANLIGSVQVRNRATIAGNLCNASPAADSVPALLVAGATAVVAGIAGEREIAVGAIPAGPGRTTLAPDEFVVEIRLPNQSLRAADAYLRMTPRSEMDIAIAGAGAWLALNADGACVDARIALGAVAPTAKIVPAAGAALVGTSLGDDALARMVEAVRAACQPIDDKRGTAA
ncbi:MAG: xanthine dehydrogenase family protein subunit M, partial [Novosphingobium sp.]